MSNRILVITQNVDETDDLLGFFVAWLRAFSEKFERVDVITLAAGTFTLPPHVHVHSLGKERGASKMLQAISCVRLLWRYTPRDGGIFCHMSPIFAIIAWPFARWRRSRLVLWYLHRSRTLRLRLAYALCDTLVTADTMSLTIRGDKIVAVGHGIDTERFAASRDWSTVVQRPLHIMSVGRIAPIKDFGTFVRAVRLLRDRGIQVEARIVGRAILPEHFIEENKLKKFTREFISSSIAWVGFVPYRDMPVQYRWADIIVGCTPRGGLDKALLEAMAAGCVVLSSNDVMRKYLNPYSNVLIFALGNARELAHKVATLSEYAAISHAMVESVQKYHDLKKTISKIYELF